MLSRMGRACAVAAVIVSAALAQPANAQWWQFLEQKKTATLPPGFQYTSQVYGDAVLAISMAMGQGDFVKLDRMYDEFLRDPVRATDGTWMIEAFAFCMEGYFKKDQPTIDRFFVEWKEKSPDSRLRPVAYAYMWQRSAWNARDSGGKVSPAMSKEFNLRLEHAEQALRESAEVGADSPIWHFVNLGVAASKGVPAEELDRRFEAGVARFPTYRPLYNARVNELLPHRGGSFERVDEFVEASQRRTEKTDGKAFYAWIYTKIAENNACCIDLFAETRASWPKMRDAYEDIMARFPDHKNLVFYAAMACLADDGPAAARLMEKVKARAPSIERATNGTVSDVRCRRLAAMSAPSTDPRMFALGETLAGQAQGELTVKWWQWAASFEYAASPVADTTGERCGAGQRGDVWFLAGTYESGITRRTCHVPAGKLLFFPVINYVVMLANCGSCLSCPSAKREAERMTNNPNNLYLELDGTLIQGMNDRRLASPACFNLAARAGAGAPKIEPTASDGYWVALHPLDKGKHTLRFGGSVGQLRQELVYTLIVE